VVERGLAVRDVRIDLVGIVRPRRGASVIDHVRGIG
jgi:putative endonuclease